MVCFSVPVIVPSRMACSMRINIFSLLPTNMMRCDPHLDAFPMLLSAHVHVIINFLAVTATIYGYQVHRSIKRITQSACITHPVCWSVGLDYLSCHMATNTATGAGAAGSLLLPSTQEPSAPDPKTPPYPPHVVLYAFGCTASWWLRPFDLGCTRAVPIGIAQGTDTTFPHHLFDSAMRGPPVRVTNRIFLGDG